MIVSMPVSFSYQFDDTPRASPYFGEQMPFANPLFGILAAIREEGSIAQAAERLGLSYRYVWGFLKKQEDDLGQKLLASTQGTSARLSDFGERLLWSERRVLARLAPTAEGMANKLDNELLLAARPALVPLRIAASHDLLFGALREQLMQQGNLLLDIDYVGSVGALEQLNAGACLMAGIHFPLDLPHLCQRGSGLHAQLGRQLRLGKHKLIRLAVREQGLIVPAGNPLDLYDIFDLVRPEIRFVNRQAGSGTRILLDELLRFHRIEPGEIVGYQTEEPTHLAVAVSIAAGVANCGFGLRAAAEQFGLGFMPMLWEQYFVVCRKHDLDSEPVRAVIEALEAPAFRDLVANVPGYSVAEAGQIISLRRTLPWYK
ncbi:MAG: helix-turn-helix transcriptional regulator [Azonexus sp.]|nr:helix-turn-helix transcriptional regulator [Azonexus sp.]